MNKVLIYSSIYLLGVIVSAFAQILLKKNSEAILKEALKSLATL